MNKATLINIIQNSQFFSQEAKDEIVSQLDICNEDQQKKIYALFSNEKKLIVEINEETERKQIAICLEFQKKIQQSSVQAIKYLRKIRDKRVKKLENQKAEELLKKI